jgi:hypothetical protein
MSTKSNFYIAFGELPGDCNSLSMLSGKCIKFEIRCGGGMRRFAQVL